MRSLREALSILQNPEREKEVEDLAQQWLEAGREVVERLFSLIPRPEPQEEKGSSYGFSGSSSYNSYNSFNSFNNYSTYDSGASGFSNADAAQYIERDEDGDPIVPDLVDENGDDLDTHFAWAIKRAQQLEARGVGYKSDPSTWVSSARPSGSTVNHNHGDEVGAEADVAGRYADSSVWNYGTMMFKLGVDPELLGWNAETDDWE